MAALLQPEYFFKFFEYMRRQYAFDVAMDLFYTFKMVLTKRKQTTSEVLTPQCDPFFTAFILLLAHAETTENYVTKRQLMEVFADLFAGQECAALRTRFIANEEYLFPIFGYLWNRNVQIRLRCLALLSQLFRVYRATPAEGASSLATEAKLSDEEDRSRPSTPTSSSNSNSTTSSPRRRNSFNLNSLKKRILTPQTSMELFEWNHAELVDRLVAFHLAYYAHRASESPAVMVSSEQIQIQIIDMLHDLRIDCEASNLTQFSALVTFLNQILEHVRAHGPTVVAAAAAARRSAQP